MSAFGTKRTCQHVCSLSAFGGKADIRASPAITRSRIMARSNSAKTPIIGSAAWLWSSGFHWPTPLARKWWQRDAAAVSPLTRIRGSTMLFLLAFLTGVFVITYDWTPETWDAGSLGHRSRLHEYDTDLRCA